MSADRFGVPEGVPRQEGRIGQRKCWSHARCVFRFRPSHQSCKPLILNGVEGFCTSGRPLSAWIGTPSRYTVEFSRLKFTTAPAARRRAFMAQPYRHPSSGKFYLRRKVPPELRAALGHEFKRSLRTLDAAEAKGRFAAAWSLSEQAFANAHAALNGEETLTQQISELAAEWFRSEVARLERSKQCKRPANTCLTPLLAAALLNQFRPMASRDAGATRRCRAPCELADEPARP